MPTFGWDASHYDGPLTTTILARAQSEGVVFFTHKVGEGLSDTEGTFDDTALAAARSVGIEFIGGYLVPRSNATVAAQVDRWIALADAGEPWWRTCPGWFWQIDLERWSYDNVPASVGIACAQEIRRRTGRWTILYASHSQYGDQLAAWDGPTWNADYTSRPAGGIAAMYPGDDWQPLHGTWRGGWAPYSGKTPTILQYTSSATIAGLTTCDANAFRGSLDELRALITGEQDMALKDEPLPSSPTVNLAQAIDDLWHGWHDGHSGFGGPTDVHLVNRQLNAIMDGVAALKAGPQAAAQATQGQVNVAVLAAMQDPTVLKGIGDAIATHLHVN